MDILHSFVPRRLEYNAGDENFAAYLLAAKSSIQNDS